MGYVAWDPSASDVARTYLVISSAFAFIMLISASVGVWFAGTYNGRPTSYRRNCSLADVLWKWLSFRSDTDDRSNGSLMISEGKEK